MAELAFAFVYCSALTGGDVLGALASLLAALLLYNVLREDRTNH